MQTSKPKEMKYEKYTRISLSLCVSVFFIHSFEQCEFEDAIDV